LVVLVNSHKDILSAFSNLAALKRSSVDGARNFDSLLIDCETRWDSELMLLERLVYFESELGELFKIKALRIDESCKFSRYELDLMYAMTLVLAPFRKFTKFVQNRACITLARIPHYIDDIITDLLPNSFLDDLATKSPGISDVLNAFQAQLVSSIKTRFEDLYQGHSLALAAMFFMPGPNQFQFKNFNVTDGVISSVIEKCVDDIVEILPSNATDLVKNRHRRSCPELLRDLREDLDLLDSGVDPLIWIPRQVHYSLLFPLAMLLLAIPATSAEDERSFSCAGDILGPNRTRLDIENFRRELRIRRYIIADGDMHSQSGRDLRVRNVLRLLERFDKRFGRVSSDFQ